MPKEIKEIHLKLEALQSEVSTLSHDYLGMSK